jgi:hypothetical protein
VLRAHLALVTGPFTADGVSCGSHPCAESHGKSSRHRRKICREPVGCSRHRRGVGWPLPEVGPTPVPRAGDSALGTELTSWPEDGSFAESWVNRLSAQSLSGPPVRPSVLRAKAIALGIEPALPRAWALALGTTSFFFSKLIVTLITYTSSQADYTHHRQLIFITGRLYSSQAGNIHHKHINITTTSTQRSKSKFNSGRSKCTRERGCRNRAISMAIGVEGARIIRLRRWQRIRWKPASCVHYGNFHLVHGSCIRWLPV